MRRNQESKELAAEEGGERGKGISKHTKKGETLSLVVKLGDLKLLVI
jgi:hypothetical protein